jgi:membrane-associated phospholipid phosphatase
MKQRSSSTYAVRALAWVGLTAVALLLASLLDPPIARVVARHPFGYSFDLYTLFRLAGYLPLWAVVSLAFIAIDAPNGWRAAWSRGGVLLTAVTLAGALAELLKLLVRRERPSADVAMYVFRPWRESPFSSSGLGWPSSHTAVAFAAVFVLCRLHPRATPVWLLVGAGCAFSRLTNNLHFLSDIVGGAMVGYIAARACLAVSRAPNSGERA